MVGKCGGKGVPITVTGVEAPGMPISWKNCKRSEVLEIMRIEKLAGKKV